MKPTVPRSQEWSAGAVAFLFALAAYLPRSWEGALRGDALLYASIARSVVERGSWTPLYFGESVYLLKPPLMFWLTSLSFRIFGFTAFAARLPSILLGAAAVAAAAGLASRWYGPRVGRGAAVVLVLSYTFARAVVSCRLESAVAFSILAAVWAGSVGLDEGRGPVPWVLAGAAGGLGLLAKGPVVLLAWPVIAGEAVFRGRLRRLLRPTAGGLLVAVALAVALPWHVHSVLRLGEPFWDIYLGREIAARLGSAGNGSPLTFYLLEIGLRYWPWLPFLLGAVVRILRHPPPEPFTALRVNLAFLALGYAAILPVRPPYDRYLVPFLCAAAPLVAWSLGRSPLARPWCAVLDRLAWVAVGAAVLLSVAPFPLHAPMPAEDRDFLEAVGEVSGHRYVWAYRYADWETKALVLFYGGRGVREISTPERCPEGEVLLVDLERQADLSRDVARVYDRIGARGTTTAHVPRTAEREDLPPQSAPRRGVPARPAPTHTP